MRDHQVLRWLGQREDQMVILLARLVNTDSNSYDKAGVDTIGDIIQEFLEDHGIDCEKTRLDNRGDALHGRLIGTSNYAPVLLMGHMDTVFPRGEANLRPFRTEGNIGYGPGAADMKAGLVMNAFIMAGFAACGGSALPLHALFTGDEEIGSGASQEVILNAARAACAVFNAEPGRRSGNIVNSRRGGDFYRVSITGRSAHAGLNPHEGRSAIHDLARKIVAWTELNDAERDISVNVGLISGGQSVNSVAPFAQAEIDLRFCEPNDGLLMNQAIQDISQAFDEDGVTCEFIRLGGFSPIHRSPEGESLTALYLEAARDLCQSTEAEFTRSCADSGLASSTGTPTVCATGPVGDKAHSPDEWVDLSTFVPRAQAVALSILKLSENCGKASS